jgi:ubiquinone/menaquinone biosynthesis C-methylase UbiE
MLQRLLEPEVMDSDADAREYDAMDHAAVNAQFVSDLLAVLGNLAGQLRVLDLGTGTAQIPIELCRSAPQIHITAIDAAESMLALARENTVAAGLDDRITLVRADAKQFVTVRVFDVVISNSILHHIPEPRDVIAAAIGAAKPGGRQFHRDLCRPRDESELERLVSTYTADATPYQRRLFADSLRAALTLEEMRGIVVEFGFPRESVQMTSDRHWTWSARQG